MSEIIPDPGTTARLHAERRAPGWEYATTEGPRKRWDDPDRPPQGEGWERNVHAGRGGWERFDYAEESYWRRPRPAPTPPVFAGGEAQTHHDGCAHVGSNIAGEDDTTIIFSCKSCGATWSRERGDFDQAAIDAHAPDTEPDHPAAVALARHIADQPVSTLQAAFRLLNRPLSIELHDVPDDGTPDVDAYGHRGDCPGCTAPGCGPTTPDEPAAGSFWERAVLERFAAGGPVDLDTVRQQVGALLAEHPAPVRERTAGFWEQASIRNGELYAAAENQRDAAREERDAIKAAIHAYADRLDAGPQTVDRCQVREDLLHMVAPPAKTITIEEARNLARCCGKPASAICVHDVTPEPAASMPDGLRDAVEQALQRTPGAISIAVDKGQPCDRITADIPALADAVMPIIGALVDEHREAHETETANTAAEIDRAVEAEGQLAEVRKIVAAYRHELHPDMTPPWADQILDVIKPKEEA